jgi:FdhD protein
VNRSILTVPIRKIEGDSSAPFQDLLAVEEPLEIRLGEKTISIMRTPGHDPELAAGFLFTKGILDGTHQIRDIQHSKNSITVQLNPDVEVDFERLQRNFYTTSSCGVCGKASIEALRMQVCPVLPRSSAAMQAAVIQRLPEAQRFNMTLLGFVRDGRFNIYSGAERIQ